MSDHTKQNVVFPALSEFQAMAATGEYDYLPLSRVLVTDVETPVTTFAKLTSGTRYLLESVERGEQVGRFSFIGWEPLAIFKATANRVEISKEGAAVVLTEREPLKELEKLLESLKMAPLEKLVKFVGGAVGYIGYDYVRQIEKLPAKNSGQIGIPENYWVIPRNLAIFDHVTHQITLVTWVSTRNSDVAAAYTAGTQMLTEMLANLEQPLELANLNFSAAKSLPQEELRFLMAKDYYVKAIEEIKEYILAGDAFQVVFSQRIEKAFHKDPFLFYRLLRTINPSPYLFFLDFEELQLVGSSPEVMVRLEGRQAVLKPIAGTRPRGKTPVDDEALKGEMLQDVKELAEHVMLVDLGRNDLGRVCRFGTVQVTDLMSVENYSHVMHIVSTVQGELLPDYTGIDLLRAVFPAGTLSGAPKIRAMEIIEELEPMRREFYGGAVGYLGLNGDLDTCITIRTILFKDQKAILQVGGGIVADSIPENEYQETLNKAGALLAALEKIEGGGR